MPRPGEGVSALAAYHGLGTGVRVHTTLRWATAPFEQMAELLPTRGHVLDFGCGHGLLSVHLALRSTDLHVLGVDVDEHKLGLAARAAHAAGVSRRVEFQRVNSAWLPRPDTFDAVVIADVLYVLGASRTTEILDAVARSVVPGGVVLAKEMADEPRWRRALVLAQEHVSVRVARITRGETIELPSEASIRAPLDAAGLTVSRHPLRTPSPHPHLALLGRRPSVT